jgi:hypothetical protein
MRAFSSLKCKNAIPQALLLLLKRIRLDRQNNSQTDHNQQRGNESYESHAASTGRELSPDDPMLRLKVSMEAYE